MFVRRRWSLPAAALVALAAAAPPARGAFVPISQSRTVTADSYIDYSGYTGPDIGPPVSDHQSAAAPGFGLFDRTVISDITFVGIDDNDPPLVLSANSNAYTAQTSVIHAAGATGLLSAIATALNLSPDGTSPTVITATADSEFALQSEVTAPGQFRLTASIPGIFSEGTAFASVSLMDAGDTEIAGLFAVDFSEPPLDVVLDLGPGTYTLTAAAYADVLDVDRGSRAVLDFSLAPVASVPEPGSAALLGVGAVGLLARTRRRAG
ncbi:MAG: PEP-CTERM sorting domain-containing protein [Gemmataceae bacterium]|nr:PEP-CTERM sorting domain-containing protein [Gemmataceae bacterium]